MPRHRPSVKSVSEQVRTQQQHPQVRGLGVGPGIGWLNVLFHFQGHFTYECKDTRPYVSRPSRTAQLENPRLVAKSKAEVDEVPEEFKNKSVLANTIYFIFYLSLIRLDD